MIEAGGDFGRDIRLLHHLREIEQEIVVIEHVLALLGLDIGGEQIAQSLLMAGAPGKMLAERLGEARPAVDGARIDGEAGALGREALLGARQAELMPLEIHQIGRILAVVDGELRIEAEAKRVVAQQPRADRMKGAGEGGRRRGGRLRREFARQQPLHAPVQLAGGAPRKGRQHDPLGIGAGQDQMGDAMGEHIGLAGAGAGDHQQGAGPVRLAGAMLDGAALGVVQFAQGSGERGGGANHGGDHAPQQSCFAFCSQGAWGNAEFPSILQSSTSNPIRVYKYV